MAHYLLSAEATFSAAHQLAGVERCDRLHGHNWRIRLTVRVDEGSLDTTGMGVDLRDIKHVTEAVVAEFDHAYLNDLEPFREYPPTTERIARVVCERAAAHLARTAPGAEIEAVDAWEMPEYRITYRPT